MDKEKLIKTCKSLRDVTLEAREQGIINVSSLYNTNSKEQYQIYEEQIFIDLVKSEKATTIKEKHNSDFKWKYTAEISGLTFFIITDNDMELGTELQVW